MFIIPGLNLLTGTADTIAELLDELEVVIKVLTDLSDSKITSVSSGCELFLRFITLKVRGQTAVKQHSYMR